MKKKLKDFFNFLEASPEVIAHGCKKEVCQLRSYVSGIESNGIYPSPRVYNLCGKKNLWFVYSDGFSNNNFEYTLLLCNIAFIHPL